MTGRPSGAALPTVDPERARRAAESALNHPGADGISVVISGSDVGLTRYAGSQIIQNTVRREQSAYVRAVVGNRVATAATNQLDQEHMQRAAASAVEAARSSAADPHWPGLLTPQEAGRAEPLWHWDDSTASASPQHRAQGVNAILQATGSHNASGIYETGAFSYGIYSSTGIGCFDAYTRCAATCLVDTGESTGWGEAVSPAVEAVDVESVAGTAVSKAETVARAPTSDAEPGSYEVVLEPSAVATLLDYLAYAGFGAKQVLEGESFLSSRAEEKVAAEEVTVADDVRRPGSIGIGFDFDGAERKRVAVIDKGRATQPVTDARTAKMIGMPLTGHSSGSNEFGPYASNVVLEPGTASRQELIEQVADGLLVTRFHYVNILDRPATMLTGMTRDGTFRIKQGEITEPVHNLRFTQNVLEALASVGGIGCDLSVFAPDFGSFGSTVAPSLRIEDFRFTSKTTH